ncbi:MAG: hypothetical protein K8R36_04005, partial [Planctomycetales bacterium]|nr:hypothetical protein [Planctomycetales bacterium]
MGHPLSDFRGQSAATAPQTAAVELTGDSLNPYQSPEIPEGAEPVAPPAPAFSLLESQIAVLMQQGKRGAGWFYSIAGFSLINSLIILVGGGTFFVLGLGVTLIADFGAVQAAQQTPENAILYKGIAFTFDLAVAGIVCGFGWLAGKRWQPIFFLGMVLYLL